MDDYAAAEDGIFFAVDGDVIHRKIERGDAIGIRFEIAEVPRVALGLGGQGMFVVLRVVMSPGAGAVWSRAIAELMDVDGLLRVGNQALDCASDMNFPVCDRLEAEDPRDLASLGGVKHGDGRSRLCGERRAGLNRDQESRDEEGSQCSLIFLMGFHGWYF